MRGVILAGGNGTRLRPLTLVTNKHLLPVYDRPMIFYPIETLKRMGCDEIIIVSGGEHIGGFAELLKDGRDFGLKLSYCVQSMAGGIAHALDVVEGMVSGVFPVILGDNYFDIAPEMPQEPTLFIHSVESPQRFGVYNDRRIIEKPRVPQSNTIVTGLYVFDERVFDVIKTLEPSMRGELEITDVNNWYLDADCHVTEYMGKWSDMGTIDSLLEVANYVSA